MPGRGQQPVYMSHSWEIDLARREVGLRGTPVALGGRAFDILELLGQSAGEFVSKGDLIGREWQGAIAEENTLHFHISAIRKALGNSLHQIAMGSMSTNP
jgi:DNA-binding winged helix-turn-helix (wHTH) protein